MRKRAEGDEVMDDRLVQQQDCGERRLLVVVMCELKRNRKPGLDPSPCMAPSVSLGDRRAFLAAF